MKTISEVTFSDGARLGLYENEHEELQVVYEHNSHLTSHTVKLKDLDALQETINKYRERGWPVIVAWVPPAADANGVPDGERLNVNKGTP